MNTMIKRAIAAVPASLMALPAFATYGGSGGGSYCFMWWCWSTGGGDTPTSSVPEIDASAGYLAVAALTVVVAFMVERVRRSRA